MVRLFGICHGFYLICRGFYLESAVAEEPAGLSADVALLGTAAADGAGDDAGTVAIPDIGGTMLPRPAAPPISIRTRVGGLSPILGAAAIMVGGFKVV